MSSKSSPQVSSDDLVLAQGSYFRRVVAQEFTQHLVGVLAEQRRRTINLWLPGRKLHQRAGLPDLAPLRVLQLRDQFVGRDLGVGEEILEMINRHGRYARLRQHRQRRGAIMRGQVGLK